MVHLSNTVWRIKSQPSNSAACSDNALCLLVLVAGGLNWGLQVMSSFSIWGCVWKGCFERGIYLKAQIAFEGHGKRLQSWTLGWMLNITQATQVVIMLHLGHNFRSSTCNDSITVHGNLPRKNSKPRIGSSALRLQFGTTAGELRWNYCMMSSNNPTRLHWMLGDLPGQTSFNNP